MSTNQESLRGECAYRGRGRRLSARRFRLADVLTGPHGSEYILFACWRSPATCNRVAWKLGQRGPWMLPGRELSSPIRHPNCAPYYVSKAEPGERLHVLPGSSTNKWVSTTDKERALRSRRAIDMLSDRTLTQANHEGPQAKWTNVGSIVLRISDFIPHSVHWVRVAVGGLRLKGGIGWTLPGATVCCRYVSSRSPAKRRARPSPIFFSLTYRRAAPAEPFVTSTVQADDDIHPISIRGRPSLRTAIRVLSIVSEHAGGSAARWSPRAAAVDVHSYINELCFGTIVH